MLSMNTTSFKIIKIIFDYVKSNLDLEFVLRITKICVGITFPRSILVFQGGKGLIN
jgi:hypothetical protein